MSEKTGAFLLRTRISPWLTWVALFAILVVYLWVVFRLHPTNYFGLSQDDTLYFSSGKAIAEGRGYILPSVPGTPPATKFPILYPWIMSWVWRANPSFPANLYMALAVNAVFGVAYLATAFMFLRRLKGLNDASSLAITAFCAFHPQVLSLSVQLLTDLLFAALVLGACVLAREAMKDENGMPFAVSCGIVSGLAILVRALGAPIAAGLFVVTAWRGGWRKGSVFAACVIPFLAGFIHRSFIVSKPINFADSLPCGDSWRMTWLYYTSYTGYWRADTLSHHVFWENLRNGLVTCFLQPAGYFIDLSFVRPAQLAVFLLVLLSAILIRGLFRQARLGGLQPVHLALACYLPPVLIWNYVDPKRFLIPFLPLICAVFAIEALSVVAQVRASLGKSDGAESKVAVAFFCALGLALLLGSGASLWHNSRSLQRRGDARAELLVEKRQAYAWLGSNTRLDARVLAYEDASLYLYTARQAMRPTIFSPAGTIRPNILKTELACIVSSAKPINAAYWLVSDDDFGVESESVNSMGRAAELQREASLKPIFQSQLGRVRIYQLVSDERPAH